MVHLGPKPAQKRKGTFTDVSPQLLEALKPIQEQFTISADKLRAIVKHFISELDRGLSKAGGNIPMIPGWVMDFPTGKETGSYLAIDLGGTNLRVVLVKLGGNRDFDTTQSKFALPAHMRTATSDELWDFIAKCLKEFVDEIYPDGCSEPLPLGFTFSYPASQNRINEGILQRWTKGWSIDGIEGKDVVPMLQKAIKKVGVPIDVVALINDTTGTLVASMYTDPEAKMGLIFGTGVNGAYFDVVKDIPKLEGKCPSDIPPESPMAINCEYGSFDNEKYILPRTKYDVQIDEESPRPGQQTFEKMISGYYLGEVLRLILLEFAEEKKLIFKGQNLDKLKVPYVMDASYPSKIEEDPFENLSDVADLFREKLGIETTEPERKIIRCLAELIGERSARFSVCGIAAICQKRGYKTAHCAADGSVYNKYPGFKERTAQALRDIYEWPADVKDPIIIVPAEDGSGVGAAVIAALTEKRLKEGKSVGLLGA
ncbi:hexokinase [Candida albicans L26]|uniref:Hexokinase-2 n=1 Tax=Candida albicans (strain SC5314 / ATCC MYA-2876) TaxID=237561 RepID=HXKB_CANAL|nr:hexokinase 2 [Candida albicans SC5314]P83776.2 RecName: Full=Hexokinase-2; AltName: Full=Cytoplasmic antigenic protein 3; AltName: Full=Hexokinase PII; AltName: Full=Hexokinase-B [Candida albicans SC5314]AOW31187.1 hexokinase 2 [Candida albicans SC5314]KGU02305.1 hexokinase [Candida albicans L26]KHC45763.1 hexokinase [Candida albicans P37039]|eukprot:XP_717405.1 hexokinase 2 [Candida albicans SC5314]